MMKRRIVVLTQAYGQTSNRLLQHVWLDSFCRKEGITFYNPYLSDLRKVYPDIPEVNPGWAIKMVARVIGSGKLLRKVFSLNFLHEGKEAEYREILRRSRFRLVYGWYFRSPETANSDRNYYMKIFTPAIPLKALHQQYLDDLRDGEVLTGVHIRRGDYATFEGGKYYYEDAVYLSWIHQLSRLFNGNCRFLVFTNDAGLNTADFASKANARIQFSNQDVTGDHYLMSRCNYLIGPPSTFTMWASFIGNKPLLGVKDPAQEIRLEDFNVFNG